MRGVAGCDVVETSADAVDNADDGATDVDAVAAAAVRVNGAIVGVGSVRNASTVRWALAGNIVWAWIFTIPASALVAGAFYWLSLTLY